MKFFYYCISHLFMVRYKMVSSKHKWLTRAIEFRLRSYMLHDIYLLSTVMFESTHPFISTVIRNGSKIEGMLAGKPQNDLGGVADLNCRLTTSVVVYDYLYSADMPVKEIFETLEKILSNILKSPPRTEVEKLLVSSYYGGVIKSLEKVWEVLI